MEHSNAGIFFSGFQGYVIHYHYLKIIFVPLVITFGVGQNLSKALFKGILPGRAPNSLLDRPSADKTLIQKIIYVHLFSIGVCCRNLETYIC